MLLLKVLNVKIDNMDKRIDAKIEEFYNKEGERYQDDSLFTEIDELLEEYENLYPDSYEKELDRVAALIVSHLTFITNFF